MRTLIAEHGTVRTDVAAELEIGEVGESMEIRDAYATDTVVFARPGSAARAGLAAVLPLCLAMVFSTSCDLKRMAINSVASSLQSNQGAFASDNDPELVRQAAPASLKLIETLLQEAPGNQELLLAAASGFTQYAYAFVQEDADEIEPQNLATATALRLRARNLYLRARDYGLRGLNERYPGLAGKLGAERLTALQSTVRADVPLLYWTAAAWGLAIALSKEDPRLIADQPSVEALIDRALALDPGYEAGAIHCFLITYEMARQGAGADADSRARRHMDQAVLLSDGKSANPFVSFAEAVCVQRQNRAEFEALLKRAIAIDVNARPEWRLMNLVMQKRAKWLLSRKEELFLE